MNLYASMTWWELKGSLASHFEVDDIVTQTVFGWYLRERKPAIWALFEMTSRNKNGVASWGILIFSSADAYEFFLINCNSAEE